MRLNTASMGLGQVSGWVHQQHGSRGPCIARRCPPKLPPIRRNARAVIGQNIAEVARNAGVGVAELMHMLNDHDIGFDKKSQRLIYACEGMAVPDGTTPPAPASANGALPAAAGAVAGTAAPGAADPVDLTLAFKLHSRPGAPRRLVLDFDGYVTTGTAWNSLSGNATIVTPPYDLDGSPSTFNDDERRNIIAIWRAVAEDYAAFDVSGWGPDLTRG